MSFQSSDPGPARRIFGIAGKEIREVVDEALDVQPCRGTSSGLQVSNRFAELTPRPRVILTAEMVQANGGLDQPLIAGLEERILGRPPEVFPNLMGVIKTSL